MLKNKKKIVNCSNLISPSPFSRYNTNFNIVYINKTIYNKEAYPVVTLISIII